MGKKVFLREAVKPTEEGGTFDPNAAKAARERLKQQRAQEVITQSQNNTQTTTQQAPAQTATQQPAQQATTQQVPVQKTTTQQPVQQVTPQQVTPQQTTTQQPVQQTTQTSNQNDDGETEEIQTIQQGNTQVQPLVTSDDGSSYSIEDIQSMINNLQLDTVAASDEEMEQDEENEIKEKVNIVRFLKCLSEKNYSNANKHLKKIIKNKVNKKITKEI